MLVCGGVVSLPAVTVRAIVVVLVRVPDVPVIVTVPAPVVAVLLAVSVNLLVVVVVAELGLKDAVTPLGRADADKLTLPLKPFCGVTVIVLVPLLPCAMVELLGDAAGVDSGAAPTPVLISTETSLEL